MDICRACHQKKIEKLIDFGKQPICNRFCRSQEEQQDMYPIILNYCKACGMVQMNDPFPMEELLPRFEWITYSEPEDHLDDLVDKIIKLPGLSKEAKICGISFKDGSTIDRFKDRGFGDAWVINPREDLGIADARAGIETLQSYLTKEKACSIVEKQGKFDLVIVRHVLEHAYDTDGFMEAIAELVKDNGYIFYEVPDCKKALERCDYTTVWEEHILYFTSGTFRALLETNGFSIASFVSYPYPFEDSLVAIIQPGGGPNKGLTLTSDITEEINCIKHFAENMPKISAQLRSFFSDYIKDHGKIALFGAGHLACKFINLLGLKDYIDFVADDNPSKKGLFMPGSQLPIKESAKLLEDNIKLCLLSFNPLNDDKVIAKNQEFINRGGEFYSIFSASKYALPTLKNSGDMCYEKI